MLTLLVPMAGRGQRFVQAGYKVPKPFIPVNGRPMIQWVLRNCPIADRVRLGIFHDHQGFATAFINSRPTDQPAPEILALEHITSGAASTVLCLLEGIPDSAELLVANCDQYLDWAPEHFLKYARSRRADGAIAIFRASDPKWSFVDMDENGRISRVMEKQVISTDATCGVYYWRTAGACRDSIAQMMGKGYRTNNEFYLAPSYNEIIEQGGKVVGYPVPRMFGMGTPEDLRETEESGIFFEE